MPEPIIIAGRIASQDTYDRGSGKFRTIRIDPSTHATTTISYPHHEAHAGSAYEIIYSVASVGGLTTPNDTMTLSFKTPNTTKWMHIIIQAICHSGSLVSMYEGKTGGGANPTGILPAINYNRNSTNTSGILDVAGTNAGNVSYDATVFTGGTTLFSTYVGADGVGQSSVGGSHKNGEEFILKQNTFYQVALVETDTVPGTISLSWYEHTDKD